MSNARTTGSDTVAASKPQQQVAEFCLAVETIHEQVHVTGGAAERDPNTASWGSRSATDRGAAINSIGYSEGTVMRSLKQRVRTAELMDAPDLNYGLHCDALAGLRRINVLSRTSAVLWRHMRALIQENVRGSLRVLDIGSGGGDVAISLARRAHETGVDLRLEGLDVSASAVRYATERATRMGVRQIRFRRADALEDSLEERFDVIYCSLFLHHLDVVDAVELLARMREAARKMILVCDLRRSWCGYQLAHVGCRLVTTCPIVHVDGPLSVAAAFSLDEVRRIAARSGLEGAVVRRCWPQRFILSWRR